MPLLNNRIEIDPSQPLPQYDGTFARAFAARGKGTEAALLALVCARPVAVRADLVGSMRSLTHAALPHVREAGVVDWPPAGGRAYAFVYDRPPGPRLSARFGAGHAPPREERLINNIVHPLFAGLNELARVGVFHGAVRAANVYMGEGDSAKAILGDNLSQPPGFGQPAAYETIERGMAEGVARGPGTSADDFYALGVTILSVLLGEDPLAGLPAAAVVNLKLERGSYAALAAERRFSPAIIELLRGLLADDPRERWTFDDFEMWAQGRRLTPKQSMAAKKASRALLFDGHNYLQPRQLARALAANVPLAAAMIQNEELSRWLAHGLHDEDVLRQYEHARAAARRQRMGPEEDRLVANVVLALDPTGPIRYRGLSVFPAGLSASMAEAALDGRPLAPFAEIILNDLHEIWLTGQIDKKPDIIGVVQQVGRAKEATEKPGLGFGPERAMYEINPSQPCLSPVMQNQYCMNGRQALEALDHRPGLDERSLVDRHGAAFILARDRKTPPPVIRAVETAQTAAARAIALLTLFGDMQFRLGPDRLRNLARLLLPLADETLRRFRYRPRQTRTREALRPAVEAGDIPQMLKLVDDPGTLARDEQEYQAARLLYSETETEIGRLGQEAANRPALAQGSGQPVAAALSVGIAFVLSAFVLVRFFLEAAMR